MAYRTCAASNSLRTSDLRPTDDCSLSFYARNGPFAALRRRAEQAKKDAVTLPFTRMVSERFAHSFVDLTVSNTMPVQTL